MSTTKKSYILLPMFPLLLSFVFASLILALAAYRLNALTFDGAVGAFVLGIFVFGIGTWKFMIPMVLFFVISSILSRIGKNEKESFKTSHGKGSKRDVLQVYANGGIPMLIAVIWFYSPSDWLYGAYLSALAAANSDTWATEIGFLSKRMPRHIVTFRTVEPGSSGGITLVGTVAGLAGSTLIALSGYVFLANPNTLAVVAIAGFTGSTIDSILGGTIQGLYRCSTCQKITELSHHCHSPATRVKGSRFISNDGVNLLCTLSAGVIFLLVA